MRVILQRVNYAQVAVQGEIIGRIDRGLLLLVGFGAEDSAETLRPAAEKIVNLRVFPGSSSSFHTAVKDIDGEILAVPQFTLYGDTKKGRRPDFTQALAPDRAAELFQQFVAVVTEVLGKPVQTGQFGAEMQVALENHGPVTLILEF